jgi:iron complex outermembrane receptor protein
VSLTSKTPSTIPSLELTSSYGSYNTYHLGGSFSTGLLWRHLIFDGAYHETNTDGYIHGTAGRSGSYYGGLAWLGHNFILRYKNFGNFEKTGQAWNGVTAGDDDLSLMDGTYGNATGIRTYKDMYNHGLGRYNSLYEHLVYGSDGNFATDAGGNYLTDATPCATEVIGTRLPTTSIRTTTSSPARGTSRRTGPPTCRSTTPTAMVTTRSSAPTTS